MKAEKHFFIFLIMATLVGFPLCFETISKNIGLEQAIEQQLNKEQNQLINADIPPSVQSSYQTLNRKRRYLEFPEGSSFQLVYDLIVGVVDFTNYLILGVTVALAWELPSKPPSEIFNDISERLKDGTLGTSRNDTVYNIKYVNHKNGTTTKQIPAIKYKYDLKPLFRPPMHYQYYTPRITDFQKKPLNIHSQISNLYAHNQYKNRDFLYTPKPMHPFVKWTQNTIRPKFSSKRIQYPWWNLPERLQNSFTKSPSIRRFDKNISYSRAHSYNKAPAGIYSKFRDTGRSEHRIYPVFGKRSLADGQTPQNKNLTSHHQRYKRSGIATEHPSHLDRIHIEHHRRTRHDLYQRIETYLNGRGSHGHHCVLRALCETGQKSNEIKPGSFVGELMRAIFTIPEPIDATTAEYRHIGDKERRYDTANELKQNCSKRYQHCKESLWSSQFVL